MVSARSLLRRIEPRLGDLWAWRVRQISHVLDIPDHRRPPACECPLCGQVGHLLPTGYPIRDGSCAGCGSLERHRLFALWLQGSAGAIEGRRVLHFAPEETLAARLRPLATRYDTADIDDRLADMVLDIENIALADRSYEAIVCFHVLEHVDDAKALAELRRILAPGGVLLVMIPIVEGWSTTYEDATITDPRERELHFGQSDHVRYYGADFRDRVARAGFDLSEFTAEEPAVGRHGLLRGEKLFICHRRD